MQNVNRRQFTFGALWAAIVGLFAGKAQATPNDSRYLPDVDPGQIETMTLGVSEFSTHWHSVIEWIPVSERLPEYDPDYGYKRYLTAFADGTVGANWMSGEGWLNSEKYITHWAELPDGPRVVEDGQ